MKSISIRRVLIHIGLTLVILGMLAPLAMLANKLTEDAVLEELENELRTYGELARQHIDARGLETVAEPDDVTQPEYQRVHRQLSTLRSSSPDFRYVYILRHLEGTQWQFVVDVDDQDEDRNRDGVIDEGERATLPGRPYESERFHDRMLKGLEEISVDSTPQPDPPWGLNMSVYVPLCEVEASEGRCPRPLLLGIDVGVETIIERTDRMSQTVYLVAGIIGVLLIAMLNMYLRTRESLKQSIKLQKQLIMMKVHLSKFVPSMVCKQVEENPDNPLLKKTERDLTVMFLDLAGYTRLSEEIPQKDMNHLLETYFSAFLDLIHQFKGDVNETAGDGLMVLFMDDEDDIKQHALNAVSCAGRIQMTTQELNARFTGKFSPVIINIGINSGRAEVGSTKFDGAYSTRWTYTASGPVTNVASRIAGLAENGAILVSKTTARRVHQHVKLEDLGKKDLKNVTKPMRVFRLVVSFELTSGLDSGDDWSFSGI